MKLTRRQLLTYTVAGIVFAIPQRAHTAKAQNAFDWRVVCQQWMRMLLPDDEFGPGADCPAVWTRIEHLMANESEKRGLWLQGLAALANQKVPQDETQLDWLLDRRTTLGRFLIHFQHFVLDSYYGSAVGWREFGLAAPAQPRGFKLAASHHQDSSHAV